MSPRRPMKRSQALRAMAARLLPGEAPFLAGESDLPFALEGGRGSRVVDVDGNEYIDYSMGWGSAVLGHAHPEVAREAARQLARGGLQTLAHPLQVEVAEALCEAVPGVEAARFGKNGSDATALAARLSRAATGREVIAVSGYHGWHDWCAAGHERSRGVPKALKGLVRSFDLSRPETLESLFSELPGQIAAVMVDVREEPGPALAKAAALARRRGAVLVFDEIQSGFRYARGGAQERFGVRADLVCLGKALANGLPLSAVVGGRALMDELKDGVLYCPSFEAEPVALAAAKAVLGIFAREDVCGRLWKAGGRLLSGLREISAREGLGDVFRGLPPRFELSCEEAAARRLAAELARRGVLLSPAALISYAHTDEDVDRTLEVFAEAARAAAKAGAAA